MDQPIKVGISACLVGEKVRYDGADQFDRSLAEALGALFLRVPVCPEVGCGFSVPREAMRLEGDPDHPRLVTVETRVDLTGRMLGYCREKAAQLEREGICGFVFKKNSPSSGLHRVPVYQEDGTIKEGRGLFAAALVRRLPALPVEEGESLGEPAARERFLERVRSYACG